MSQIDTSQTERNLFPSVPKTKSEDTVFENQPNLFECFLEFLKFNQYGLQPFHFGTIDQYQNNDPKINPIKNKLLQKYLEEIKKGMKISLNQLKTNNIYIENKNLVPIKPLGRTNRKNVTPVPIKPIGRTL